MRHFIKVLGGSLRRNGVAWTTTGNILQSMGYRFTGRWFQFWGWTGYHYGYRLLHGKWHIKWGHRYD